jgi:Spy/CpxP family protein refolding chaperone
LFQDLRTSPEQERVLQGAMDDLRRASEGARREWSLARSSVAQALVSESFDETAVHKAYARLEIETQQLRDRLAEQLRQVHEVLTPEQRRRLATAMGQVGGRS